MGNIYITIQSVWDPFTIKSAQRGALYAGRRKQPANELSWFHPYRIFIFVQLAEAFEKYTISPIAR